DQWAFLINSRQRPTLPHTYACSTIGGGRLNFRVRNGNGCDPAPITTGKLVCLGFPPSLADASFGGQALCRLIHQIARSAKVESSQTISKSELNILQTVVSSRPPTQRFLRALHCYRNN